MRVQPHLPSKPFTATVIESCGAAWCACSAANSPAPPEPRIRMSVSTLLTLLPLNDQDDGEQPEADGIEQRLRIDEHESGDDQHQALGERGALEEPALQAASQRRDADRGCEGNQRDRAPVGVAERLDRARQQES